MKHGVAFSKSDAESRQLPKPDTISTRINVNFAITFPLSEYNYVCLLIYLHVYLSIYLYIHLCILPVHSPVYSTCTLTCVFYMYTHLSIECRGDRVYT